MKAMTYHISDYHRHLVCRYYAKLIHSYGLEQTMKQMPRLQAAAWQRELVALLERHI